MTTKTAQMHANRIPTAASTNNTSTYPISSSPSPSPSQNYGNSTVMLSKPYIASNIDDFLNNNEQLKAQHEAAISSSSENDDNYSYEPYSRRDFRIDVKTPSDKISSNDTSSGYFTSPNENERLPSVSRTLTVLSPDSDYERYEIPKDLVEQKEQRSTSPVESQSGRSIASSHRKSVSFDLDVEEYTPEYSPDDFQERMIIEKSEDDDDEVLYDPNPNPQYYPTKSEPKRIKGILRSPSPGVFVRGNLHSTLVENEYIDETTTDDENPFKKEFRSQESLVRESNNHSNSSTSSTKIPIRKPIFMSTGSLIDRERNVNQPPPRPPQPVNVKLAEMRKNQGLENISKQMDDDDFLEFVHNAETNKIVPIERKVVEPSQNPEDFPLPPLPKVPPPKMLYHRSTSASLMRPKEGPPPPPTPTKSISVEEIVEILPVKYNVLPSVKPKPAHFENSQNNILVTEDEHREILLTENEIRNAMLAEYEEVVNSNDNLLISSQSFSPNNPFLDDVSTSTSTFSSQQPTPTSFMSPVPTIERTGQPPNVLPPPTKILPVHYGQLPKPQQAGYFPLISQNQFTTPHHGLILHHMPQTPTSFNNNYTQYYPLATTGISSSQIHHLQSLNVPQNPQMPQMPQTSLSPSTVSLLSPHNPQIQHQIHIVNTSNQPTFDSTSTVNQQQKQKHQQEQQHLVQLEQQNVSVSGDGQKNLFYLYHDQNQHHDHHNNNVVNNPSTIRTNQQQEQFEYAQSLLMQSAYVQFTQPSPSPPIQASNYAPLQYAPETTNNNVVGNSKPQFIHNYHYQQQQQQQYPQNQHQQTREIIQELSPIRINQLPQNFIYNSNDDDEKVSMTSFGKQTEV
jgi:hypothetical protein